MLWIAGAARASARGRSRTEVSCWRAGGRRGEAPRASPRSWRGSRFPTRGAASSRCRGGGGGGVGQRGGAPAVYGIVGDRGSSAALAERVRGAIDTGGLLYEGGFSVGGARVWRDAGAVSG